MISLDAKSQNRIENSRTQTKDKLYLIARYVEEKYLFQTTPMYWEDKFEGMAQEDRAYYKTWLWLSYVNWEMLTPPVPEVEATLGTEFLQKITEFATDSTLNSEPIEQFLKMNGKAGEVLLNWAKHNLIS